MSDESNVIPGAVSNQFLTDKGSGADQAGNLIAATGDAIVQTLGKGLRVKGGVDGRILQALGPMVAGDLVVANTSVTAASVIIPKHRGDGAAIGSLYEVAATRVPGVSFEIKSTNAADVGHFDVLIVELI